MSVFPKLGKIDEDVFDTIKSRAGNNLEVSKLTSWLRVSSAVENEHGTGLILETIPTNQTFASTYGTSNKSGRVGTTFDKKDIFAENDRGFRPSPVIEAVSIQNGHQGLSRKATFTIKCFTLAQAEIITKYFYQPGFVVLLEYGWNTVESMQQRADLSKNGACEIAKYNNYNWITQKRSNSKGTYDGFMGRITGGGYQSGNDETYTIDVELTTLGEIPTYLQIHKTGVPDDAVTKTDSSLRYTVAQIKAGTTKDNDHGTGLFQQMYNLLPNEKRSRVVKSLTSSNEKDVNGFAWTEARNFINVDKDIREKLLGTFDQKWLRKDFQVLKTTTGFDQIPTDVNLPEGSPLISDQSYIRLELAFKILNRYSVSLERTKSPNSPCDEGVKSYSYIINTNDTIIGAHRWMFSIDGTKLFIPNQSHPNFGLEHAFSDVESKEQQIINIEYLDANPSTDSKSTRVTNLNPWVGSLSPEKYAFPSPYELEADITHKNIIPQTARAHQWGYLRNLYINLDFFIDTMSRSNFVAKDIYYEILNGISAAAGSQWNFELAEVPHETRIDGEESTFDTEIKVVDLNFVGAGKLKNDQVTKFYSKGIDTPFLTSNLNMPIPAAMRNQILGKYNSSVKLTANTEGSDDDYIKFFSGKLDPVSEILNSFKETTPKEVETKTEKVDKDDIIKSNFDIFMNKATVVPKKQWRHEKFTPVIDKHLMVVAWEDSKLLKQIQKKFTDVSYGDSGNGNKAISQILSIDFSFEIHGVSGLKIGDVFQIVDLPSQFKRGVFQIMEQSHDLSDGLWKTSVTAKMRNFEL